MDTQYRLQFDKLFKQIGLGQLICAPQVLSGGLLHQVFSIHSTTGKYAVKALNPQIMLRPTARQNYVDAENITALTAQTLPALPAKIFQGQALQEIGGQYYLIFDWSDKKPIKQEEITTSHCHKIGSILAHLHNTDFATLQLAPPTPPKNISIDWHAYLQKGGEMNAPWVTTMQESILELNEWQEEYLIANQQPQVDTISHRDLDPKNTLWGNDEPLLIDWEAAGFINATQDLLETALYWSKNTQGKINFHKLSTFIHAYQQISPKTNIDWTTALKIGLSGQLDWLEYNLKRSLGIECVSIEEKELGSEQVILSIKNLKQYEASKAQLEEYLQIHFP